MPMRSLLALAAALALAACDAPIDNQSSQVYPPITGSVDLHWRLAVTDVVEVDYSIDGQPVGHSTDAPSLFAVELDSTKFPNGLHRLTVAAIDATGLPIHSLEHTVRFQN